MTGKTPHILLVAGARPNFMKIAPLWRELRRHADALRTSVVHTGQHYDAAMSDVFFDQLELPTPDHHLGVGSGSHAEQTAAVMTRFEKIVAHPRPDIVVVVGDVNSTLAAALTAVKLRIPIAHVEAGLRSFDMKMPEEVNRLLTDRVSTLLFATEPVALANLAREGVEAGRVHLVGNVMIDALMDNLQAIRARRTAERLGLAGKNYGLATIHRPANVDTAESLRAVLAVLREAGRHGTVVFPVHPRTAKNIVALGLRHDFDAVKNLRRIEPLGYMDFMSLLDRASYVMTDSGGIQVETTWLGVPCLTLRPNTEHILTVEQGCNRITGLDVAAVRHALDWARGLDAARYSAPSLWDGKAAPRITAILSEFVAEA